MRELQFRAWSKLGAEMLDVEDVRHLALAEFERDSNLVWMQSTGLTDRTGRVIYEGDIIRGPFANGQTSRARKKEFNIEVYWAKSTPGFEMRAIGNIFKGDYRWFPFWQDCYVIGNIYQHSHLLEAK